MATYYGSGRLSGAVSLSHNVTVPAGTKLLIAVFGGSSSTSGNFSGATVTAGGVAMTNVGSASDTDTGPQFAMFYLIDPPTGTVSIAWTRAATSSAWVNLTCGFYEEVVTGVRDHQGEQGVSTTFATPSVAAQAGDLIIMAGGHLSGGVNQAITGSNVTVRFENFMLGDDMECFIADKTATGAQTAQVTYPESRYWGVSAAAFIPGSSYTPRSMLLGVG